MVLQTLVPASLSVVSLAVERARGIGLEQPTHRTQTEAVISFLLAFLVVLRKPFETPVSLFHGLHTIQHKQSTGSEQDFTCYSFGAQVLVDLLTQSVNILISKPPFGLHLW